MVTTDCPPQILVVSNNRKDLISNAGLCNSHSILNESKLFLLFSDIAEKQIIDGDEATLSADEGLFAIKTTANVVTHSSKL